MKICLVTGASSGIGYAIAEALQADGYTVVATARREDRLQQLPARNVTTITGDLSDAAFQDQLISTVYEKYGRCDYLFNCAGTIATGTIEEIDIDKVTDMIQLNVTATIRLTYQLLKRFRQQGFGHVINMSSVLGTKVRPTAGAYAATKFAMEALSEALRMELTGSNIQVSCIEPGLVMTELHKDWNVHPKEGMGIHEPLTTDDIVGTVRFIMQQPAHVRIPRLMILPKDHNI
ncbi:MAG: SDR family oxidoreductase [Chitinophaga sp.]|uniref:SDR family oxidoreductase n=1 Tax=Chitinophaga sp. TaxID=1869181 RepID=UPI001B1CFBB4|nr:SDR family oxidoreductase [Chitinophaga sp.]MBO9731549.1 SDR family oxidoreductase [Chitinophaga sp.]